jgi:pilus assembly protein CpaE
LVADNQPLLKCILIGSDEPLNGELLAAIRVNGDIEVLRTVTTYPAMDDLLRTVRVRKPHFLFLCVDDFASASALAAPLGDFLPTLPIVALTRQLDLELIQKLMHLGIRDYLTSPIESARLGDVVTSTQRILKSHPPQAHPTGDLYTFLPAKPGVGCSTIAVGVSCALAEDLGARTLLVDSDLSAGAIKFLLKVGNSASIIDAVERAGGLDEDLWSQLVGRWENLDVLHAGELSLPPSVDLNALQSVLSVARAQYEVICVDLASSLDPFSVELMRESRRIFVVSTPELTPLYLAAERVRVLKELGLGDRISLVLNRKTGRRGGLPDEDVVRLVGLPVSFAFSNDYFAVQEAILEGGPVSQGSDLGQNILNLARSLAPQLEPKKTSMPRRFLEFFHVPRIVEADTAWHD